MSSFFFSLSQSMDEGGWWSRYGGRRKRKRGRRNRAEQRGSAWRELERSVVPERGTTRLSEAVMTPGRNHQGSIRVPSGFHPGFWPVPLGPYNVCGFCQWVPSSSDGPVSGPLGLSVVVRFDEEQTMHAHTHNSIQYALAFEYLNVLKSLSIQYALALNT